MAAQLSLKSDSKEIDGLTISTTQFPAMRSFRLLARLLKVAGPALGALKNLSLKDLDIDQQLESGADALAAAFAEIDPAEASALLPEILNATTANVPGVGEIPLLKEENINIAFSGERFPALFKTLAFALQVNYAGFGKGGAPAAPTAALAGK